MKKRSLILLAGISITILAAVLPSTFASAALIPQPPASVGTATTVAIPNNVLQADFVDQNRTHHTLAELKGSTAILVPLLTLCGDTCPFTSANMLQIQQKLSDNHIKNVRVIGIDVDPYRDTPARLMAYTMIINANFQIWTAAGSTSVPSFTKAQLAMKDPLGSGDINQNLLAIEKFLGYSVQVVPQSNPPFVTGEVFSSVGPASNPLAMIFPVHRGNDVPGQQRSCRRDPNRVPRPRRVACRRRAAPLLQDRRQRRRPQMCPHHRLMDAAARDGKE